MKVVFTGGGTGGHFFPLIAVAEQLNAIVDQDNLADVELYYFADKPYDKKLLYENSLQYEYIPAGKIRVYPSLKNIRDMFITGIGCIQAFFKLVAIYPDVIFSKGGYSAFPTVFAARILNIPVIIHESDSVPGRVSLWSGKFAHKVASSYKQVHSYFSKEKLIHTGQPIRVDLQNASAEGAHQFLGLDKETPVIWIIGGSLGAQKINEVIEEALPQLLPKYQVIHQTGEANYKELKVLTDAILSDNPYKNRYHIFPFLNKLSMKMAAGVSDVIITRAGSMLFEIAHWRIPAIVIPITHSQGNHQIRNAYSFAREGAGIVIEENNLSDNQLVFEINRIYDNPEVQQSMKEGAERFDIPDAAKKIAQEIVDICLEHELS
jgi:UDP-N-acetylglucosamine--N-acetylmuramyl-(pentapeptide) pyrophosphoryl-undecaprenol N-acetylglucosamine transferase